MEKDNYIKKFKYYHKFIGITLIIFGVILYPTPVPGTTFIIILGFVWFIGKEKTLLFMKKIFNKKVFKYLKIRKIIKEI